MLDYRMETFLALCGTMNYGRAAEALHVTQPAVTRHIQALEEHYGCKLFTYEHRSLALTAQGEELLRYAQDMAYREKKLIEALGPHDGTHLRIGATRTVGDYVMGLHVASFLSNPANTAEVSVGNTRHLLSRIDNGRVDFAVIEGMFDRTRYASKLYAEERFSGICPATHPFAGKTVSLEECFDKQLVLREKGSGTRAILEQALSERNHALPEFRRVNVVSSFALIMQLLGSLGAITFGYEALCRGNDRFATFQVEGWDIVREFNYVYLDNSAAKLAVDAFASARPRPFDESRHAGRA